MGGQFKVIDKSATKGDPRDPNTKLIFDALTWGEVSKGPDFNLRSKDQTERIMFGIRWKKHTFTNCIVLRKTDPFAYETAAGLRIGDPVAVLGRLREYSYTPEKGPRKGKTVQGQDCKVSMLIPQRMIASLASLIRDGAAPDQTEELEAFNPEDETEEPEW